MIYMRIGQEPRDKINPQPSIRPQIPHCNQLEYRIEKQILFPVASNTIKYLGMDLMKTVCCEEPNMNKSLTGEQKLRDRSRIKSASRVNSSLILPKISINI